MSREPEALDAAECDKLIHALRESLAGLDELSAQVARLRSAVRTALLELPDEIYEAIIVDL